MPKRILILTTGGTIASMPTAQGLAPTGDGHALLDYIPQAAEFCQAQVEEVFNLDSTNFQPEHWLRLARRIRDNFEKYDGFVITHGTDTMAYTAAALSYLIQNSEKPHRSYRLPKAHFRPYFRRPGKNLVTACGLPPRMEYRGCISSLTARRSWGTRARKVRSRKLQRLRQHQLSRGRLYRRQADSALHRHRARPPGGSLFRCAASQGVSAQADPGMEPEILEYLADHYDAIVIESYGVGGIPFHNKRNFLQKLQALTEKGKLVVLATQVMLEGSDAEVYEVGARAIRQYNALQAYDMTVEAAVVKLMWIMGQTRDPEKMRQLFYQPVQHDILV